MAPEKDGEAGHSADVSQILNIEWVIEDVSEQVVEQSVNTEGSQEQFVVDNSEMQPKQKKVRQPRKQDLKHRMVVKGFSFQESEPLETSSLAKKKNNKKRLKEQDVSRLEQLVFRDTTPMVQGLDMSEVGLVEEVVTSLEREWSREGNAAAATLTALEPEQQPAWQDEEDLNLTVEEVLTKSSAGKRRKTALPATASKDRYVSLLKEQYEEIVGTPKWAELKPIQLDEDHENFSRHCGDLLGNAKGTLAPTTLAFTRLADLTERGVSKRTIISGVDFHPTTQAGVVCTRPGLAAFFQVDGVSNTRIQSVMFENFPISSAKFTPDGSELILGSECRSHLQSYEMVTGRALHIPCPIQGPELTSMSNFCIAPDGKLMGVAGKDGSIILMTGNTREWVGTVKMSGKCNALSFSPDSSKLLTYGKEGYVYVWDVKERRCIHKFQDEGCMQGLSIAMSADSRYVACGSGSGVVNIYSGSTSIPSQSDKPLSKNPRPAKAIMNLTTPAHQVVFNPSAQILATVSRCKDSAIKLVHLPSLTVFANFPTFTMELARPEVVAFSPNSGYMAIGNNIGSARLFRLEHFPNY